MNIRETNWAFKITKSVVIGTLRTIGGNVQRVSVFLTKFASQDTRADREVCFFRKIREHCFRQNRLWLRWFEFARIRRSADQFHYSIEFETAKFKLLVVSEGSYPDRI